MCIIFLIYTSKFTLQTQSEKITHNLVYKLVNGTNNDLVLQFLQYYAMCPTLRKTIIVHARRS